MNLSKKQFLIATALVLLLSATINVVSAPQEASTKTAISLKSKSLTKKPNRAESFIKFINNTSKKIKAAVVMYDSQSKCWVCMGWYEMDAQSSRVVNLGVYNTSIYVHGRYSGFFTTATWGKGYKFCVKEDKDKFQIQYVDKTDCKEKAPFSEIKVVEGANKFTFSQ